MYLKRERSEGDIKKCSKIFKSLETSQQDILKKIASIGR